MYENELKLAKEAVLRAGELLKELPQREIKSDKDKDIKLEADVLSEQIILESYLFREIPCYDVLSEERGFVKREDHSHTWIVDPLDGSANFAKGMDELCCISIALWKNDEEGYPKAPVLGVIYRFKTDELYSGIVGSGAWKNDAQIRTGSVKEVKKAILATGFPVFRDYSTDGLRAFIGDIQRFKKIRMLGSAAIMGALVAEGKIDAYMEDGIMLWDVAASVTIALAAGGDVNGISLKGDTDFRVLCRIFSNPLLEADYIRGNQ